MEVSRNDLWSAYGLPLVIEPQFWIRSGKA